ncbi:MAG: AAA family ATPase [Clostridia bacterium]|nr:AAA family ATPase [Clostridia bacterium]
MLLEFTCTNYKSIREEVQFSALAGRDETHFPHTHAVGGMHVLRAAVIYGPNGSGKSNVLDALAALCRFIGGEPVCQVPHKLEPDQPSRFALQFFVGSTRYAYGLSLHREAVTEEYLYHFPRGRQVKVFERTNTALMPGSRYTSALAACGAAVSPSAPVLATPMANTVPALADARRFLLQDLVFFQPDERQSLDTLLDDAIAILHTDADTARTVGEILGLLGTGIRDIRPNGETASIVYDSFTTDLRREESTGIRRLIGLLCPLARMLREGKTLICDEPETNLHETVVHALLNAVCHAAPDSRTQLIFATHSTALLDLELLRRDQIWFTELRPEDRSTDLYSLAEIRGIRQDEDIRLGYLSGKYGALPSLGRDILSHVEREEVKRDG